MSEVSEPVKWRCFHCDACFTESQHKCAREHFGSDESKTPVCLMRVPGENGLIAALRRAENDLAEWRSECHPMVRFALGSKYRTPALAGRCSIFTMNTNRSLSWNQSLVNSRTEQSQQRPNHDR